MSRKDADYPIFQFATQEDWRVWLDENYKTIQGVWLKFAKKGSGVITTNYQQSLDVALCYGWIDGQTKSLDTVFYLQKFTPRGPKSMWSKRNRDIVEQLIAEKKMQPAGLEAIDAAKKDGRWEQAYDSPKNMQIPEDLLQQLSKHKKAEAFFQSLNKTNTYAIVWRLQTAKKQETRERRLKVIMEMLERGEKLY